MRIVHVINSLDTGGAERMVVELAIHGARLGHEVEIVALADGDGIPARVAADAGLPVSVVGRSRKDPRIAIRLGSHVRGADIVHAHLFPAMYWAAGLRGPKVFTEHSTNNRRMGRRLFRLPERWAYDRFDRIVAIGHGVERRLNAHAATIGSRTPIVRAQNGISDGFFATDPPERMPGRRLIAIGSLTSVKQHTVAIDALAQLPDATLDIAGEGPLRPALEAQIAARGLGDRVRLLGSVDDVPALLQDYDLMLSTSLFEGFSLVAAEAQARGLPVVGPDVEGFDDVVVDGGSGILSAQTDAAAVARAVREALEPHTYRRLSAGAIANAGRFTMDASFRANHAVYAEVLASRGQRPR